MDYATFLRIEQLNEAIEKFSERHAYSVSNCEWDRSCVQLKAQHRLDRERRALLFGLVDRATITPHASPAVPIGVLTSA